MRYEYSLDLPLLRIYFWPFMAARLVMYMFSNTCAAEGCTGTETNMTFYIHVD